MFKLPWAKKKARDMVRKIVIPISDATNPAGMPSLNFAFPRTPIFVAANNNNNTAVDTDSDIIMTTSLMSLPSIVANQQHVLDSLTSLQFASKTTSDTLKYQQVVGEQIQNLDPAQYLQAIRQNQSAKDILSPPDRSNPTNEACGFASHLMFVKFDSTHKFHFDISRDDFLQALKAQNIPSEYILVLGSRSGAILSTDTSGITSQQVMLIDIFWKSPKNAFTDCSVAFQYNPHDCSSNMLLLANSALLGNIHERLQRIFQEPFSQGRTRPAILLSTIVSEYSAQLERDRIKFDKQLRAIEAKTGIGCYVYNKDELLEKRELGPIMHELYRLDGLVRVLHQEYEFQLDLLVRIEELISKLNRSIQERPQPDQSAPTVDALGHDLLLVNRSLSLTGTTLTYGLKRTVLMQQQTQIQLEAVRTMLAKHDSETSVSIARESRNIATETRHDSTSMKTVAGLTLVFLPATFAATLFSTIFFDRKDTQLPPDSEVPSRRPADPKLILMNDWWLYVAVTIPLTVVVVVIWMLWLRWERNQRSGQESSDIDIEKKAI